MLKAFVIIFYALRQAFISAHKAALVGFSAVLTLILPKTSKIEATDGLMQTSVKSWSFNE